MIAQIMDMPMNTLDAGNAPLDAPVFRLAAANEIVPRFEFRIFGHDFVTLQRRIRKVAPCESIVESKEISVLSGSRENGDRNVKIREGKLEFKRLIDRINGLERWKPTGSLEFPIDRAAIPDSLFPVSALERTLPFPDSLTAMVTEKEFLHHIAQDSPCGPRLYRANVFKRRSRFTLQDCPVEIDWILVNGAAIESIAIESRCAEQVLAVRSALGLEQFENVAYPLAISRILGIRTLPDAKGP